MPFLLLKVTSSIKIVYIPNANTAVKSLLTQNETFLDEKVFNYYSPARIKANYIEWVRSPKVNIGDINN